MSGDADDPFLDDAVQTAQDLLAQLRLGLGLVQALGLEVLCEEGAGGSEKNLKLGGEVVELQGQRLSVLPLLNISYSHSRGPGSAASPGVWALWC